MNAHQLNRIEELKQQIRSVVGYDPVFGTPSDCPPEVEEKFLKRVLWYEQTSKEPLLDRLAKAGIIMAEPDALPDDELSRALWNVIPPSFPR